MLFSVLLFVRVDVNHHVLYLREAVLDRIRQEGLHTVYTPFFTTMRLPMELPRRIDLEAVVCRMRRQRWK